LILAVLETHDGTLKKISHQVLTAAHRADELLAKDGVTALVVGPGAQRAADEAARLGVVKVLCVEGEAFATYTVEAYTAAVLAAQRSCGAQVMLFGATTLGRDVAPRLSAKLDAGLLMDVPDLLVRDGQLGAHRAMYGGKVIAEVLCKSPSAIVTVRPNTFPAECADAVEAAPVSALAVEVDPGAIRARVREVRLVEAGRAELTEANIVVAGGKGLEDAANFHLIEELADALGGAVGTTRAVVDAGWRPHHEQVGQTGKTIAPKLYIGVGISGAVQHITGILSSGTIVGINNDAEAPLLSISDYGVVGNALEILPHLIKKVREL